MKNMKFISKLNTIFLLLFLSGLLLAGDTITTEMSKSQIQKLTRLMRLTHRCSLKGQTSQNCPDVSWVEARLDEENLFASRSARVPVTIRFAAEGSSSTENTIHIIRVFLDHSAYPLKFSSDQIWAYRSLFKEFFPKEVFVALKQQYNYIG